MRPTLAALALVLAGACVGPRPPATAPAALDAPSPATAPPAASPPRPSRPAAVTTATPAEPVRLPAGSSPLVAAAPTPAPTAPRDAALGWLPAGSDARRGVQTAVAVIEKPGPLSRPEQLDPRALAADPESHAGKTVVLFGQVARVIDREQQRWAELLAQPAGETLVQAVDLLFADSGPPVEREECYQVAGVAAGRVEIGRGFAGATRDAPLVLVTEVATAPVGPYGIGCAPP